jgi:integrase/recombinase XerD
MNKSSMLGPWIRRFLIEHLVAERNLAINTQKSYRDMLLLLLPYLATKVDKRIDRLTVDDLSPQMVRLFLTHMEEQRHCAVSTRNQRLGGIHALARFIGEHAPEYVAWWAQIHLIPIKRTSHPQISYLNKPEMDALLAASDVPTAQGRREHALLLFMFNSGARASEAAQLRIGDVDWLIRHTTASLLLQAGIDINTIRGWLGHVSLTTTNICAEINLETKARALAACEVESDAGEQKHWRDQPDLMAFVRTL